MKLSLPSLLHPSRAALDALASGDEFARADGHDSHLARCATCRDDVAFRRALREAVVRLPEREPPPRALAAVLAARARGDRFFVRDDVPDARARRRRVATIALGTAAALSAIAGPEIVRWRRSAAAEHRSIGSVSDDLAQADSRATSTGMFASVAGTPEPPGLLAPPALEPINGDRLQPMRLSYATRYIEPDDRVVDLAERADIRVTSEEGENRQPMWRVMREWHGRDWSRGGRAETEVLWLSTSRLEPISRTLRIAPYGARYRLLTVTQRFLGDRMVGEIEATGVDGRSVTRPIAQPLSRADAPYLTDALVPFYLGALAPTYGWTGRATVAGWGVLPNDVAYPVTMRVVGDARVTVPLGTFDCWHLVVTSHGRAMDYWVRKRDGVAVRSLDAAQPSERGRREIVLVADKM